MHLLQKTLSISALALAICSVSYAKPLSDPFLQEWDFFNGITTYKLVIGQSAAPGQDYHIYYTFVGGDSSTDMCKTTSNTSFECQTGEVVTRDDMQHLVRLNDRGTEYVFYDPKYIPATLPIFGNWTYRYTNKYDHSYADFTITITRGRNDKEFGINTSIHSSDNSIECSNDIFDPYQVTDNPDGTKTVSYGSGIWKQQFKLDTKKMQITSADPSKTFSVGMCINISSDMDSPVFIKK